MAHSHSPARRLTRRRGGFGLLSIALGVALLAGTVTPGAAAAATPRPKLLFGMGGEAGPARTYRMVQKAPIRMLSSWYNGPGDLSWITNWKNTVVPQAYRDGYALHLIVYTDTPEVNIATKYGIACGRPYPLSGRFLSDMRKLAQTFAGAKSGPPLYVTMFTEFQTYPCTDNSWRADARARRYYNALKDRYLETMSVFHNNAPNARVSIGWGGWQARWDQPDIDGGRSLIKHFGSIMRKSDFESFQAMASDSDVNQIRDMTKILGKYGPVMLAHFLPQSTEVADADLHTMMTDDFLRGVVKDGLFAWSFMDERAFGGSADLYRFAQNAVWRYGRQP